MTQESIAKRYVKALIELLDESALQSISTELQSVSGLFSNKKFVDIISSVDVASSEKENIIIESIENPAPALVNLVKLLGEKNRLELIPVISEQVSKEISLKQNIYIGKLISGFSIEDSEIKELETKLSKKFDSTVKLENIVKDFSGIKVELDELGVEVSFSLDRLKSQMSEHILKAI